MYISCPNCATRYNVSSAQIGAQGKSVKCSNCGNTWHQMPVADPPPPMMPQGAPQHASPPPQYPQQQPGAYPYPPPGYPPYPPYPPPPGYPAPPGYPPPPGAPDPAAATQPAAQPAPEPAPAPEPEPEPEEDFDLPEMDDSLDDDPMAAFEVDDDSDEDSAEEDELSPDDLDAMFADEDEPETLSSMVGDDDEDDDDDDVDDGALDDLEEPEPIPQVFTADETGDDDDDFDDDDEDEEVGRGPLLKIILAVVLVLVIMIVGAVVLLRETITEIVPAAEGLYSIIGMEDDSLGAGLSIKNVKSARESIGGKDVLVVRGEIANISDRERPLPMLELRLLDLDAKLVQSKKSAPLKSKLAAGDKIGFKIQIEDVSALAQGIEITFVDKNANDEHKAPAH